MVNPTQHALLRALLVFAKNDRRPCTVTLAAYLGRSCIRVDHSLWELDRLGLVDAERVRLSMSGLALAAGLGVQHKGRSQQRSKPHRARRRARTAA